MIGQSKNGDIIVVMATLSFRYDINLMLTTKSINAKHLFERIFLKFIVIILFHSEVNVITNYNSNFCLRYSLNVIKCYYYFFFIYQK